MIISETWIKLRSSAFFQPEVYFLNWRQSRHKHEWIIRKSIFRSKLILWRLHTSLDLCFNVFFRMIKLYTPHYDVFYWILWVKDFLISREHWPLKCCFGSFLFTSQVHAPMRSNYNNQLLLFLKWCVTINSVFLFSIKL